MSATATKAAEAGAAIKRKSPVRVAVVQFNPQVGLDNLESNALAARQRLQQAVKEGANLIVLPELATTGYCFHSREEAFAHAEPVPDGQTVRGWIAFAKEKQVYLVGCLPEADGHQLFDTAVLVGPDRLVRKYRDAGPPRLPRVRYENRSDRVAGVLGHLVSRDRSYR